eukprot:6193462-Pleurochrysis_carterae.AAC.1
MARSVPPVCLPERAFPLYSTASRLRVWILYSFRARWDGGTGVSAVTESLLFESVWRGRPCIRPLPDGVSSTRGQTALPVPSRLERYALDCARGAR